MSIAVAVVEPRAVEIDCQDGVALRGHIWPHARSEKRATVIVNPATGVLARYYHRYAAFLASHGFDVITYDYRGIGASRPASLRSCGYRWRDWGERDFEAVLGLARRFDPAAPLMVVGHSIGGFLLGLAPSAPAISRVLTIGAQYAFWRDYAADRRLRLFLKWHVAMPALTALCGYFPGRRLGWLEDLPAGVANDWSFRCARMELSHPEAEREDVLRRFAAVSAPILAVGVSDDDLGTPKAIARALAYYTGASTTQVQVSPGDFDLREIGHFGLLHSRHRTDFWLDSLIWLRDGINPWPNRVFG